MAEPVAEQRQAAAESEAGELKRFLQRHPSLRVIPPGKKVRCTLTGHELPCRLPELQAFTAGKKYLRLSKIPSILDYSEYEPHIVPSTKNLNQLFCKLTLRHLNKIPEHVLRHVQGWRYQKALRHYEECQKKGVEFVPACLLQKQRQRKQQMDHTSSDGSGRPWQRGRFGEPPPDCESANETDDSLSDLYPPELFPEKSPASRETADDFMTDSDEDVPKPAVENGCRSDAMEVDSQTGTKRRKEQAGSVKKKFKKWNRKPKKLWKSS